MDEIQKHVMTSFENLIRAARADKTLAKDCYDFLILRCIDNSKHHLQSLVESLKIEGFKKTSLTMELQELNRKYKSIFSDHLEIKFKAILMNNQRELLDQFELLTSLNCSDLSKELGLLRKQILLAECLAYRKYVELVVKKTCPILQRDVAQC